MCANRKAKIRAARDCLFLMEGSPFREDDDIEDANSMELVAVDLEHCFVTSQSSFGLAEELEPI